MSIQSNSGGVTKISCLNIYVMHECKFMTGYVVQNSTVRQAFCLSIFEKTQLKKKLNFSQKSKTQSQKNSKTEYFAGFLAQFT